MIRQLSGVLIPELTSFVIPGIDWGHHPWQIMYISIDTCRSSSHTIRNQQSSQVTLSDSLIYVFDSLVIKVPT